MSPKELTDLIREYGRLMHDAGMDDNSDFADRQRDGKAKRADADEIFAAIEAEVRTLAAGEQLEPVREVDSDLESLRAKAKNLRELHMVGSDEWNDVCRSIARATLLVTMTISVARDGDLKSDVQTHDNSYAEVAVGLAAVKKEIERVFAEHKNCPYYPRNAEEANQKILRAAPLREQGEETAVLPGEQLISVKQVLSIARSWMEPLRHSLFAEQLRAGVGPNDGSAHPVDAASTTLPLGSKSGATARGASCFDNGCNGCEQCIDGGETAA